MGAGAIDGCLVMVRLDVDGEDDETEKKMVVVVRKRWCRRNGYGKGRMLAWVFVISKRG